MPDVATRRITRSLIESVYVKVLLGIIWEKDQVLPCNILNIIQMASQIDGMILERQSPEERSMYGYSKETISQHHLLAIQTLTDALSGSCSLRPVAEAPNVQ